MDSQIPRRPGSLLVVADAGSLRGFQVREEFPDGPLHLQEIDLDARLDRPGPLSDEVSDQAGRFPGGGRKGMPGGMSYGEAHGKIEEGERRRLRGLATSIEALASERDDLPWSFAAPAGINARVVQLLSESVRRRLSVNLTADLTRLPVAELEKRLLRRAE